MSAIRIIIADDHPMVLRGVSDFLKYEKDVSIVRACADGRDAFDCIQSLRPDIALLDVSMPKMSGLHVLAAVNKAKLPTRVLFLSAAASSRDIIAAMADGAYGFLRKDASPRELLHCIREIAAGRKCVPFELFARVREDATARVRLPIEKLLTEREWKVMALAAEGLSNKEIARRLNMTAGTAKIHLHHIFKKLGVKNRTALVNLAFASSTAKLEH